MNVAANVQPPLAGIKQRWNVESVFEAAHSRGEDSVLRIFDQNSKTNTRFLSPHSLKIYSLQFPQTKNRKKCHKKYSSQVVRKIFPITF